jgi:hypothetical protein
MVEKLKNIVLKAKEIEALEGYIKTENEYWNKFAFDMLCEILQVGQFENAETLLQLFSNAIDIFTEHHEHPLKAVSLFVGEMDKEKLNPNQRLFVYEWVIKYIKQSEFGEIDLTPIENLLNSQQEKLKAESQPVKPLTKNIRETLKELIEKEFEKLPDTLKELEPVQRLNILCKLIPFVLPKVESVNHELNEPSESTSKGFNW